MKLQGIASFAVVLTLVWTTGAEAAVLRTAPFPGDAVGTGAAACYITNAGTSTGNVSAILYDKNGTALESISPPVALAPHVTTTTPNHGFADSPTHCVCVVPSATTYRCSFVYFDKALPGHIVVIGAP